MVYRFLLLLYHIDVWLLLRFHKTPHIGGVLRGGKNRQPWPRLHAEKRHLCGECAEMVFIKSIIHSCRYALDYGNTALVWWILATGFYRRRTQQQTWKTTENRACSITNESILSALINLPRKSHESAALSFSSCVQHHGFRQIGVQCR